MTRHCLSKHFVIEEFHCRDGTEVPEQYVAELKRLCETFLEPMRHQFGSCSVHSGFRTPDYNDRIGGARLSFHVYTLRAPSAGVAADVSFGKGGVADWYRRAKKIRRRQRGGNGGIGNYPQGGFLHVDSRDYPADWNGS